MSDASGNFQIQAVMVGYDGGIVTLRRTNGRNLRVPLEKLSRADQEFVLKIEEQKENEKNNPFKVVD